MREVRTLELKGGKRGLLARQREKRQAKVKRAEAGGWRPRESDEGDDKTGGWRLSRKARFTTTHASPSERQYHIPLDADHHAKLNVSDGGRGHHVNWHIERNDGQSTQKFKVGAKTKQRAGVRAMRGVIEALSHDAATHKPKKYIFRGGREAHRRLYDHAVASHAAAAGYRGSFNKRLFQHSLTRVAPKK